MAKEKLSVVKIGGNVIENPEALATFLEQFSELEGKKVLVHGGGKRATHIASKLGIESQMVNGRRITDAETLEVITMVYGGLVNKNIVAQLQSLDTDAIGLTGADINSIASKKRPVKEIDYGFVGDVKKVNHTSINKLIEADFTPVFCAITHDENGQLFNTNADTIASELAIGLSKLYKVELVYCFEKNGVLMEVDDDNSVIDFMDSGTYEVLKHKGVFHDGMLPKLENCYHAIEAGVSRVFIGNPSIISNKNQKFTTLFL
ncbi:acetylglutamate kinase [Tamlana sp. s12]|uniref:acetylglutamate kinase n=1 Tax=Tamlana sp. s12 TaxID=1630406 RepID=UPI0007FC8755|nr:acetylglutamate kinase [Tamlana sp. s12]OBQ57342.1 acetylglutamate kinase [Tamlana sp. s12]QQY82457.1 acetylglutamate kinase [Tamlana sp. s12]